MTDSGVLSFIDRQKETLVELESLLCAHPALSPDSGGEGELDKCVALEAWLRGRGFDALERHDAPDRRAKGGVRPSLVLTIPGRKQGPALWIMSHTDVVPPGELSAWKGDPWTVAERDGRLYGRGVEDNQQGLCASVLAALALKENGIVPEYPVKLLFVADEENGSEYGIQFLLRERTLFNGGDMVLIPDGGDEKGETIEVAEKNIFWLRILTTGRQCHGSRPDQGSNAHLAACELAVRLHDELPLAFPDRDPLFEPDRSTFEPTKKENNVPNVNTIPGDDVFYMDMRVLPRYPLAKVLAEIERIMREVETKRSVSMRHETVQRGESVATAIDAPIVGLLSASVREIYGVTTRAIGIGGGTVGAYLRNIGIDSVVWGRLHETAHQPNEYVLIENVLGDAKVMASLMLSPR